MSTYLIVLLDEVKDAAAVAEYRRIALPLLEASKGKFLVRNGKFEVFEGPAPQGVLVLEFPSREAAHEWYDSPQYQEALRHRYAGARCRVILVDGV